MDKIFSMLRIIVSHPPKDYFEKRIQEMVLNHQIKPDERQIMEMYLNGRRIKREAYYNYLNRNAAYF